MSIFGTVKSKHWGSDDGSNYILSPTEMTEVVEERKGEEPYIMQRAELKKAIINGAVGAPYTYTIGRDSEGYAPFYPMNDGSIRIGCQYFDAEQAKILRKWALDSMTKDEYSTRYVQNQKIEGFGMETTMHMPCPFCGAPDFTVYKIFEVKDALAKGGVCEECDRGAKTVFHADDGSVRFETVQTQGDDAPSYLPIRRV